MLIGVPTAERLVHGLRARGVRATVRQRPAEVTASGTQALCPTVVALEGDEGAQIELWPSESTLVCQRLETCALLREVIMEALVEL